MINEFPTIDKIKESNFYIYSYLYMSSENPKMYMHSMENYNPYKRKPTLATTQLPIFPMRNRFVTFPFRSGPSYIFLIRPPISLND